TTNVVITVTGSNEAPVAQADTGTTLRDTQLVFTPANLLGNDADADGDTLSIQSVTPGANGTVDLVGGNLVFTPTAGYVGQASFTYTVKDSHGATSTATVTVNVQKPNTPPDAIDDAATPSASSVGLRSEYFGYNESASNPNLTNVAQIYSFINGRTADATFVAKSFDYGSAFTAGNNLGNGTNLQTFLGSDASSLSADPATTTDAIIRMRGFVQLNAGTYNFKILADDGYQIRIDGVVVAEVDKNQSVATTTHTPFTLATSGLHNVEILYWDQGNHARLKVELSGDGGTTYNLLSSVPIYQHSVLAATEDSPLTISAATLLGNDTDADGDPLTIDSVQGATNGIVALVNGNIIFTPAVNYSGPASFTYTVKDGKGGSDTATVNLTVEPANDAPVATSNSAVVVPNATLSIPVTSLLANDTDVDGDKLSIVSVQAPQNGTVSISGSNVVFVPASNYEGPASFTYTVRDPMGATSTATVNVAVGAASAPSVVVAKSLLAVAQGTGGTSVKFPVNTSLVDTDGSESLSIKISGVPTGLSFNAGTNLGGGVWQFVQADLANLTLNLPGSYTTLGSNLTVQVTSTEVNGGATASVSSVVTLKAAYTTVDITTTDIGSYTGSSVNEHITGGNDNNTIDGSNGNNIIKGGAGNDILSATSGSDIFYGGSGDDIINSGAGTDRISGGSGNDTMSGGAAGENFVDVFVWSLGDQGAAGAPASDTIQNFSTAAPAAAATAGSSATGGDVLDLRDLLQGESIGANNSAGNLANFLHFEVAGGTTTIHISHTGGFSADAHTVSGSFTSSAETQKIVLSGVNLQSLYSGATSDQQIITQLLNNNKLITD
ncbi:MAG TPA: cadherin-like domain-containing protein, partial [Cellvibrio sp.]|nr:cadherin-like domain-containing protein [Cellvibrio sp.]